MEPEKPSFHNFIKSIPEETLEQQLGYVDPGNTTELLLYPELEPIITCIQENADCSLENLGKNLGLRPQQISQVIEAHPGDRGLQIRCVICSWIEANQSVATVRALLEGLWQSDDTNALACVQDLELEVQGSRRKAALNAAEGVSDSVLPPGSQFISTPFQRTDSLDQQFVVVTSNGTLTQRSLHKDDSSDSTTEESVQETVLTVLAGRTRAVLPTFLLHAQREEMPLELARQQPHEATESSVSSTETEIVAVSEIRSIKPSQESMGEMKEELARLKENFGALQLQTHANAKKSTDALTQSTDNAKRIKDLEEELKDKIQEIEKLHRQICELKGDKERLCTEKQFFEQKTKTQLKELTLCNQQKDEEIKWLKSYLEKLQEELKESRTLSQGEKNVTEDVDASRTTQPSSTDAPEKDLRSVREEDTMNPKMWILEKELGKGSFGKVYICRHKVNTAQILAVKVIDVEMCGNKSEKAKLESFTKEVFALKQLKQVSKHSRIVEYVETDIDVSTKKAIRLYIFMEYMPGGTLRQYIEKHGRMELSHVRKYTRQILEGVAHLHENNFVHRDIKGDNILLDSEGNIKLADFGCSKTLENIDIDGKMSHEQGTICWRAPETVKTTEDALQYVFESDIWSVGATVIELITGEDPYYPKHKYSVILILGSKDPADFQTPYDVCKIHEPDQHMVTFFNHCFRREPSERLSAQELLQTTFCCI